jgi:hypothetical protein
MTAGSEPDAFAAWPATSARPSMSDVRGQLRAFALSLPEAWKDFP